jgi:hypothetical protein
MEDSTTAGFRSIRCPLCEVYELEHFGDGSARCTSCKRSLDAGLLGTLWEIRTLPDALGAHACECGHPEMRRLPDSVCHCPACGSEVLPFAAYALRRTAAEVRLPDWPPRWNSFHPRLRITSRR